MTDEAAGKPGIESVDKVSVSDVYLKSGGVIRYTLNWAKLPLLKQGVYTLAEEAVHWARLEGINGNDKSEADICRKEKLKCLDSIKKRLQQLGDPGIDA